MIRSLYDLFVPHRIIRGHIDSFTGADQKPFSSGIVFFYGVPLIAGAIAAWRDASFLNDVVGELLAAIALVGSVLVGISAVLVQAVMTEAQAEGHATQTDRRRVRALRNVHGTVAYGAMSAFLLASILIWMAASPADVWLHAVAVTLLAHVALSLLRVIVVSDVVVEAYAKKSANRFAA